MKTTTYQIKVKEKDVEWDSVSSNEVTFKSNTEAIKFCNKLNEMTKCEIRLNEYGSNKGTYFNLFTDR